MPLFFSANVVFSLIVALKTKQHGYVRTTVGKCYLLWGSKVWHGSLTVFYRSFTLKWKISKLKSFERNILPLFQSFETISYGMEKKFQMPVLSILGLG